MEAHDKQGTPIRIEQVISVGLVGDKDFMMETAVKAGEDSSTEIMSITGFVTGFNEVAARDPSKSRATVYIKGALEAINKLTGEKFISGQLILPDSGSGYITAQITAHAGKAITIDATIVLERAKKSIVGYKYAFILNSLTVAA